MDGQCPDLCNICRGITEENTRFSYDGDEKNVYYHQPSLVALEESALNGCSLCALVFHDISSEEENVNDLRLTMSLSVSAGCLLSYDEADTEIIPAQAPRESQGIDQVHSEEDLLSCVPLHIKLTGHIADGTARVIWCNHHFPPAAINPGGFFVSRNFQKPFQQLQFVMSGRPWNTLLRSPIQASVEVFTTADDPLSSVLPNRPLMEDKLSDQSIQVINRWIATCDDRHHTCGKFYQSRDLPTRLLDLMPSPLNKENSDSIYLVSSKGDAGIYATLSYCWGTSTSQKTTKSTFESRLNGISVAYLPKTIRHAVYLCRMLKIRYLWVDALCIVQDDATDWALEASNMAKIYSLASLTISADIAADASEGFLGCLNNRRSPWIDWKDPCTTLTGRVHFRSVNRGLSEILDESNPLLKRGWTLQERLLSTRILHFGKVMAWECREGVADEVGGTGDSDLGSSVVAAPASPYTMRTIQKEVHWRAKPELVRDGEFRTFKYWSRIIIDYMGRDLTNPTDKLPALSGLAKDVMHRTGDRYFAGLWLSCLPESLLWHRKPERYLQPAPHYRAPSWSWAAMEGEIDWWRHTNVLWVSKGTQLETGTHYEGHPEIEVRDIAVDYCQENSLGAVKSGFVVLSGPMKELEELDGGIQFSPPDPECQVMVENNYPVDFLLTRDSPEENIWMCLFDQAPKKGLQLYALRVHMYLSICKGESERLAAIRYGCLILERVEDYFGPLVCYRRLGVAIRCVGSDALRRRESGSQLALHINDLWNSHSTSWDDQTIKIV